MPSRPNVLFIMTDQQRFDTIAALGNPHIVTPNLDRLAARGVVFANAYSTCPVCIPARYVIRTGREPDTAGFYSNQCLHVPGRPEDREERCGPYLARTMGRLGYRTFGIGKFHAQPWDEDLGFDVHLHSEETYRDAEQRAGDAYASFIEREHPEYAHIEQLMGERSEMYYQPQVSPLPAELGVEAWAADRAIEQLQSDDARPYFGFVSFIGPHPPFAPPVPYNRMYDPDRMPAPFATDRQIDHMDQQIPSMNHMTWVEETSTLQTRVLRSRYYGEITYIDRCIGRILDAVDARGDAANTVICFFSDHGDHLGYHHAWQKESFFEQACHVPFLVSWPGRIAAGSRSDTLVSLADLFGIATTAAGEPDFRDGEDLLGVLEGHKNAREHLLGLYGRPGTGHFKVMVREGPWKYIYLANGGAELLFHLEDDPFERTQRLETDRDVAARLRGIAERELTQRGVHDSLDDGKLRAFPFTTRTADRVVQMGRSKGLSGFPDHPSEVLRELGA